MRQPGPAPEFTTHLNRRAVDRQYGVVIGIWAVLALVGLIGFISLAEFRPGAGAAAAAPLVFTLVCLPNLAVYVWVWRRTRALDPPLVLGRRGLTAQTPRGRISLPWAAIASIEVVRRTGAPHLSIRLRPGVGPGAPGIQSSLSSGGWRIVQRQGLWFSFRIVDEPVAVVTGAVSALSDGLFNPALSG